LIVAPELLPSLVKLHMYGPVPPVAVNETDAPGETLSVAGETTTPEPTLTVAVAEFWRESVTVTPSVVCGIDPAT
jgi:hypothetical protein